MALIVGCGGGGLGDARVIGDLVDQDEAAERAELLVEDGDDAGVGEGGGPVLAGGHARDLDAERFRAQGFDVIVESEFIPAKGGSMMFDGQDIAGIPAQRIVRDPRRKDIQMVFQDATDRLLAFAEVRLSTLAHAPLQAVLMWDFHLLGAMESWKARHGKRVRAWLAALAEFDVMYGTGISREGGLLDVGVASDVVSKSGAWFNYGETRLGQQGAPQIRAFTLIGFLLFIQLVFGLLFGSGQDWVAEVAGFATGFLMSFLVSPGGWSRALARLKTGQNLT